MIQEPNSKVGANKSHPVVMPKLGLTMTQATIVEWLREDGDQVEIGELLFVIESDKSVLEIEAPASGRLHILVPAGDTVPVHQTIGHLVQGADSGSRPTAPPVADTAATPAAHAPAGQAAPVLKTEPGRAAASPKARTLAQRLGIPLEGIAGTGARGMIVAVDVEGAVGRPSPAAVKASPVARRIADRADLDLSSIAGTGPGGRVMRQDVESARDSIQPSPATERTVQPLGGLRAIIAERLSSSWRERPHVTLTTEADTTNLISARQQAIAETGGKVSYDAFLVALVARALREHPYMNVQLTERGLEQLGQINVGVAVDTERGLLVPVVRNAAAKSLLQVQDALQTLVDRTLAGKSLPDDLAGGTFTITNLGMFEIDAFAPIINPPESAILGVGRIVARPVAVERTVVVRDMMALSLSFDHRLIDGAPAARFLQRLKQLVERPFALAVSNQGQGDR